jgi:hypothetical protein
MDDKKRKNIERDLVRWDTRRELWKKADWCKKVIIMVKTKKIIYQIFLKYLTEKDGPRVAGKVMWGAIKVILMFKRYYRRIYGRRRHIDERFIWQIN